MNHMTFLWMLHTMSSSAHRQDPTQQELQWMALGLLTSASSRCVRPAVPFPSLSLLSYGGPAFFSTPPPAPPVYVTTIVCVKAGLDSDDGVCQKELRSQTWRHRASAVPWDLCVLDFSKPWGSLPIAQ